MLELTSKATTMQIIKKLKPDNCPPSLLEIPDPPKQLYLEGELPSGSVKYLTVVGSRKFTTYGQEACRALIKGLKGYPIAIVSGLAFGIDTIAHEAALEAGLFPVAFPGSGLSRKVLAPASNERLAQRIIDAGGGLVSEFEPDQKGALWTFPRRNRLMAGIADAVLIIEAEEKSGTLITAKLATDYNRDLLVVPGSIFSPTSAGTNGYIRLGAFPVTKSEDILEILHFKIDENKASGTSYADATAEEKILLEILREPRSRDELIRESDMEAKDANATLSIMEIKGYVKEELGKIWRI